MIFSLSDNLSVFPIDVEKITIFSSTQKEETFSRQEFFNKFHYYSFSVNTHQPKSNILNYYENFYLALHNLSHDNLGCFFKSNNELNIFIPLYVIFSSSLNYLNRDFFSISSFFSSVDYPHFDHILVETNKQTACKIHFMLPLLGAISTFDLSVTSLEDIKKSLNMFINDLTISGNNEIVQERYFKYSNFFRFYSIFVNNIRTKLLGSYNIHGNEPLKFMNINDENIIFHHSDFDGSFNLFSIVKQKILIVQEYAHGEWFIFHNGYQHNKQEAEKIYGVLRAYYSRKNFVKFLTEIYGTTEVIPFNLFEDINLISMDDILNEISKGDNI